MNLPLPCIICDSVLESAIPQPPKDAPTSEIFKYRVNQPYKGTAFESYGHYGSTVFDPMSKIYLQINICDSCLIERKSKIILCTPTTTHNIDYREWDPEND